MKNIQLHNLVVLATHHIGGERKENKLATYSSINRYMFANIAYYSDYELFMY